MGTEQSRAQFEMLLDENRRIVYTICNSYCANPNDRDDLAQEIIAEVWRSFGSFDGRGRFSTWLYRVALNVAISFYRRERRRDDRVVLAEQSAFEISEPVEHESDRLIELRQFIASLDPFNKALMLLYLDGYAHNDIASVLGITETNVGTKIGRIKDRIRQHFSIAHIS